MCNVVSLCDPDVGGEELGRGQQSNAVTVTVASEEGSDSVLPAQRTWTQKIPFGAKKHPAVLEIIPGLHLPGPLRAAPHQQPPASVVADDNGRQGPSPSSQAICSSLDCMHSPLLIACALGESGEK